jgi:hypothetical protein
MLVCATVRADVRPAVDGDQNENRTDLKPSGAAQIRERDRRFESLLLQRPVCLSGAFRGYRHRGPAFAANVSLDETRERDMQASNRLAFAFFL